ncbi:MAG: DUF2384 domain-containing protein [Gammaproteobacteria bacterium]|nr:DUF2384 domain-containing protein [Gammaproteobacteria bacterium]
MNEVTPESRLLLTKATMRILDSWKLGIDEMCTVLGLPEGTRGRSFQKFRNHEPFPDDPGVHRRADYVLRIAGALRTTYPTNSAMAPRWLRQSHRRFGKAPLSVLLEGGEGDLLKVLAELDCTVSWDLTDANYSGS